MEMVGKVVRKEIGGGMFCFGKVQSYDPPSGYYEILYVNGVTETSKFADFAAILMGEESKPGETPVQVDSRKRSRKQPREKIKKHCKKKLEDEVNVMRNLDLNDAVPEDSEGVRGNVVDLNCAPVETLALDLNRAVPEPDEGLSYDEEDLSF